LANERDVKLEKDIISFWKNHCACSL